MKRTNIIAAFAVFVVFVNGACEKAPPPPAPPTQAAPAKKKLPPPAAANPARDDPATPAWLPDPDEIPGWVRSGSVRALAPTEWEQLDNDNLKRCLGAYSIKTVLTFRYESVPPAPGGAIAEFALCQATNSTDAFGLATCMMPVQPHDALVGSMSSLEPTETGQVVQGWQGDYFVHVESRRLAGPEPRISVEKLAAALVRPIPTAEPPRLLSLLSTARRIPGRTWVTCKHLGVLPAEVQKQALRGSALQTTKALGLSADTRMAVVAYDAGDGEAPNYIWLVEYPTHQDAMNALGQYKNMLRKIKPMPLVLMETARDADGKPVGRYLCGTWTADQESIMNLLPVIADGLPK
jgi:hypothetical protein